QIEFNYSEAKNSPQSSTENELFSRLVNLDEEIKRKALRISIIEGMIGILLLVTGYNFLTILTNAFLSGILFFCFGIILLAGAYPMYHTLVKKARKKYSPVVLTITNYLIRS
ncbi:MAG: hypothetical protein K6F00_10835, partial [Lachnospiraceae bacterium]|nr:hypothetical protein [Lachnospiraceae bacterium]